MSLFRTFLYNQYSRVEIIQQGATKNTVQNICVVFLISIKLPIFEIFNTDF